MGGKKGAKGEVKGGKKAEKGSRKKSGNSGSDRTPTTVNDANDAPVGRMTKLPRPGPPPPLEKKRKEVVALTISNALAAADVAVSGGFATFVDSKERVDKLNLVKFDKGFTLRRGFSKPAWSAAFRRLNKGQGALEVCLTVDSEKVPVRIPLTTHSAWYPLTTPAGKIYLEISVRLDEKAARSVLGGSVAVTASVTEVDAIDSVETSSSAGTSAGAVAMVELPRAGFSSSAGLGKNAVAVKISAIYAVQAQTIQAPSLAFGDCKRRPDRYSEKELPGGQLSLDAGLNDMSSFNWTCTWPKCHKLNVYIGCVFETPHDNKNMWIPLDLPRPSWLAVDSETGSLFFQVEVEVDANVRAHVEQVRKTRGFTSSLICHSAPDVVRAVPSSMTSSTRQKRDSVVTSERQSEASVSDTLDWEPVMTKSGLVRATDAVAADLEDLGVHEPRFELGELGTSVYLHSSNRLFANPERWGAAPVKLEVKSQQAPKRGKKGADCAASETSTNVLATISVSNPDGLFAGGKIFGAVALAPSALIAQTSAPLSEVSLQLSLSTAAQRVTMNSVSAGLLEMRSEGRIQILEARGLSTRQTGTFPLKSLESYTAEIPIVFPFECQLPPELPPSATWLNPDGPDTLAITQVMRVDLVDATGKQVSAGCECKCMVSPAVSPPPGTIVKSADTYHISPQNSEKSRVLKARSGWKHLPETPPVCWTGHCADKKLGNVSYVVRAAERICRRQGFGIWVAVVNDTAAEVESFSFEMSCPGMVQTSASFAVHQPAKSVMRYQIVASLPDHAPPSTSADPSGSAEIGYFAAVTNNALVLPHKRGGKKLKQKMEKVIGSESELGASICIGGGPSNIAIERPLVNVTPRCLAITVAQSTGSALTKARGKSVLMVIRLRSRFGSYHPPAPATAGVTPEDAELHDRHHREVVLRGQPVKTHDTGETIVEWNATVPVWWRHEDGDFEGLDVTFAFGRPGKKKPEVTAEAQLALPSTGTTSAQRFPLEVTSGQTAGGVDLTLSVAWSQRFDECDMSHVLNAPPSPGSDPVLEVQMDNLEWTRLTVRETMFDPATRRSRAVSGDATSDFAAGMGGAGADMAIDAVSDLVSDLLTGLLFG